jgi:nitroreductase
MELQEAIRNRRSIRSFRPDPVPEDRIRDLLELANWAPSSGNLQSRDFVVVRDPATRRALARAALDQEFVAEAPAVIVVCANARRIGKYGARGRDLYMIQDAAAATQNLLLAAHAAGLGTVWIGAFDEGRVRQILGLPAAVRPLALIPLGKPAEQPEPPERLPLSEILHWDRW